MTHEQVVRAVYNKQVSSVNCMGQRCKGTCNCYECSENLVTEYEDEIRVKTIDEFVDNVLNGYSFEELLNRLALKFILEDVKKDMLKEVLNECRGNNQ